MLTAQRMLACGRGTSGWQQRSVLVERAVVYSRTQDEVSEGVMWLNESFVRGREVQIRERQLGFYLHVDDGVVLSLSAKGSEPPRSGVVMHEIADG